MAKVKVGELVKSITGAALREAIVTAKPKYKDLTDAELAEKFGLTEFQFGHLADKALGNAIAEKLEVGIEQVLLNGDSLEVPHQFNVFVHTSKGTVSKDGKVLSSPRLNKNGEPSKKLSVRTRRNIKDKLNN